MGWAAGFSAGSQMARNALDAYDQAKAARAEQEYRAELEKINQGRNLKALGIEPSGGIGVRPVQLEGIQQVPGAAPTGPNYLASMPNAVAMPDIGLGAPEQAQQFTGFTGGAAQLAESMDPRYGLQQKIALAEKYGMDKDYARYLGQQDKVTELERAEAADRESASRYAQDFGLRSDANARAQQAADNEQADREKKAQIKANEATFVSWTEQNPTASSMDMTAKLGELGITGSDALTFVKQSLGVRDEDIKRAQAEALREFKKHRGFDAKLVAYNDSDVFSPGFSLDWNDGTKELVELDDSGKEISRTKFSSKNEAQLFMGQRAQDEDVALKYIVDRDVKAAQRTIERMREDQEFNLKVMESVQDKYATFAKNNPMLRGDELDKEYDKIFNETVKAVSQGLTLDPSASTRGMPTSNRYGGTTPDSAPAPAGQGGGLNSDRAMQTARERAEADREYPATPQEIESHNEKFPEWVKYADPGQLIKMANEGDGIVINFLKNHPLNKFRELLGSFEKVPTAMERTAQGTAARRGLE